MELPGYLTAYEAAERLNLSHAQVCRYAADGTLKGRKVGNLWLFKPRDVAKFRPRPVGNPGFQKK